MADQLPTNHRQQAALDEQRQASRFCREPGTDFAVVWQKPGDEMLFEVHDESLTGLCLVMVEVSKFPIGATATLVYHHDFLEGTVRHIAPRPDGRYLVGFECHLWREPQP